MTRYISSLIVMMLLSNICHSQILTDFETPASSPVLSGSEAAIVNNPDLNGNGSNKVAYYKITDYSYSVDGI